MKEKRQLDSEVLQNLCVYVSTDHVFMGLNYFIWNLNSHGKRKLRSMDFFLSRKRYSLWCSIFYCIPQTVLLKKPECGIIMFILSECRIAITKCISQWQIKELVSWSTLSSTLSSDSLLALRCLPATTPTTGGRTPLRRRWFCNAIWRVQSLFLFPCGSLQTASSVHCDVDGRCVLCKL